MQIKALYSVAEVARMTGLTRFQVHRWLESEGIYSTWIGGKLFVSLHALRVAFPEVWESIVIAQQYKGEN